MYESESERSTGPHSHLPEIDASTCIDHCVSDVIMIADRDAGGGEYEIGVAREIEFLFQRFFVIVGNAEIDRFASRICNECSERL